MGQLIVWLVSVLFASNFPADLQLSFLGHIDNRDLVHIAYAKTQAELNNIDSAGLISLFICESRFETDKTGDTDKICDIKTSPNYGKVMRSRGHAQISDCSHPEVSDEQAEDFYWATDWTIGRINKGRIGEWWHCSKVSGLRS